MRTKFHVAVVGATGAVGREMIHCLENLDFPVQTLRLLASERSKGKVLSTKWGDITVEDVQESSFDGLDLVFFSAGKAVSLEHAPRAVASRAYVIDNTSAFRLQSGTPLVVPEINPETIGRTPCIIANPNCSTIQMVLALKALDSAAGLKSVRVATYQSCSGAGQKGIDALIEETQSALNGARSTGSKVHARGIAFDVVPQIGAFQADGYSEEEQKMMQETKKILSLPSLKISATCVRVPVMRGHSEAIFITTHQKLSLSQAKQLLAGAPGLSLSDADDMNNYPTATQSEGQYTTYLGRIREDYADDNALTFWIVSDNLLKGAALNAVQIAQFLLSGGHIA